MRRAAAIAVVLLACRYDATTPLIAVRDAYVVQGAGGAPGALYLTLTNAGTADTLRGISLDRATSVTLHVTGTDEAGRMSMSPREQLTVPARGELRLVRGGLHGMVAGLDTSLARGDSVLLQLTFARTGVTTVSATVITAADVDSVLAASR